MHIFSVSVDSMSSTQSCDQLNFTGQYHCDVINI